MARRHASCAGRPRTTTASAAQYAPHAASTNQRTDDQRIHHATRPVGLGGPVQPGTGQGSAGARGTPEAERPILHRWYMEQSGPMPYRYLPQYLSGIDPRAQTEDLGDDGIAHFLTVLAEEISRLRTPAAAKTSATC